MEVFDTPAEFVEWIDATLAKLNGPDAALYASDVWPEAWEQAIACADYLGLAEECSTLGGPLVSTVVAPGSPAAEGRRRQLRRRLVELKRKITGADTEAASGGAGKEQQAIAYFLNAVKTRLPAEISKAEIAQNIGCHEKTLSKGKASQLHSVMEAFRSQPPAITLRKGSKDKHGNLEAIQ